MSQQPEQNKTAEEMILDAYKEGRVVFNSIEGYIEVPLESFIKQPVDGILYDLNRSEEVVLMFTDDPKWINDYAACKVIRALYEQTASLQKQVELLQIRDEKREARESNLHKENGGLHAQIESLQKQVEELREENERLKKQQGIVAKDFFYWWFNTPGTNTEQGYESYLKTDRYKALNPQDNRKDHV